MDTQNFVFNDCGICTNPESAITLDEKWGKMKIYVAQSPSGRWSEGLQIESNLCGYSHGAAKVGEETGFPTSKDAIIFALRKCMCWSESNQANNRLLNFISDKIKEYSQPRFKQLELDLLW